MTSAELDVCPTCGHVQRARGDRPGLCPEAFTHPGQRTVPAPGTQKITTDGRTRTRLVRVQATWKMPT